MRKHNPKNERIKRRYLAYLEDAKRMAPKSADQAAAAIAAFEASTGFKDFAKYHIEQARKFKRDLAAQTNSETGKPLAKSTTRSRLMALKAFFQWLAGQAGYRRIAYADAEYFNPSANDVRIASAKRDRPIATVEQFRDVALSIRVGTDIDRRDQALIAFAPLSGARDDAIASLAIGHVDLDRRIVFQDARSVRTKNRKTITSSFFPVGADLEAIVVDWIAFLKSEMRFGADDPLFPATLVERRDGLFTPTGLDRRFWKNADAIRRIFRERFQAAGLPYSRPHSVRDTLTVLGDRMGLTTEELKAWSQNLGHDNLLTTLSNYGPVTSRRQVEIFDALRSRPNDPHGAGAPDAATIKRVLDHLSRREG